jgi:23S rRNA (adenine2503-C2)-methyltransferase
MPTMPAATPKRAAVETLPSPLGFTATEYADEAAPLGYSEQHASDLYRGFFRDAAWPTARGAESFVPRVLRVLDEPHELGPVRKFLLPVAGVDAELRGFNATQHLETESVIIPMRNRRGVTHTLCVSSQIGCAMGCGFCETARMGLIRSLAAGEIVMQWHAATHQVGARIDNIVFMGMGEPLDNYDAVVQAIRVLTDHLGANLPMKRVSISTVGRLDGLERLAQLVRQPGWRKLNLAVSVNAPNDAVRSEIMPINRAMPLAELVEVLKSWPGRSSDVMCVEYVLIPGVNDRPEHADELSALLDEVRCCVNVIPYNPRTDSPWPAPAERDIDAFLRRLESNGTFCKQRKTKGRGQMAACGQLGNASIRGRRYVGLRVAAGAESG